MKFFTLIFVCMLAGAELDLFIPSFPELQKVFGLTPFMVQWTLSVNFCAYCASSLVVGALGDRFGCRPVLLWGLVVFIGGSILCTFPPNYAVLILGRFLQGVGTAAPAVLAYVVIAEDYPPEKQPHLFGLVNGVVTIAVAFAPVVGSYINLFFNWRGNFLALLIFGVVGLLLCYVYIPFKEPVGKESSRSRVFSLAAYVPLLRSKEFMTYVCGICFLIAPYWVFTGMAPLLYMEALHVPLAHFGFYQGTLAGAFAIVSLTSGFLLRAIGHEKSFYLGWGLALLGTLGVLVVGWCDSGSPLLITAVFIPLSIGVVFPVNMLYPRALAVHGEDRGKGMAILLAARLILSSLGLQVVSFFYQGTLWPIALATTFGALISAVAIVILLRKKSLSFMGGSS